MATQQKAPMYVSQEVWDEVDDMSDVLRKMEEDGSGCATKAIRESRIAIKAETVLGTRKGHEPIQEGALAGSCFSNSSAVVGSGLISRSHLVP
jgi:hypothetical protein